MKFSYNWLKELSGTKKSPEQLAEVLALRAFEVEGIEKIKGDSVLEIKILADRGHDCLSHIGIAREICAIEGRVLKYNYPKFKRGSTSLDQSGPKRSNLSVIIKDKKLCPRYIGVVMNNIKVKPSPMWVQNKLEAAGLRPINNIVDATNYVMLEYGQPMHAFDMSKVKSQKSKADIIVRKARNGEKIKLLDETEKVLSSEDLVIADSEKALALAGIMGGEESGVTGKTKTIILESANFDAKAIRKTRIRLGLKTESSDRFEKELDPNLAEPAMARAIEIIGVGGGKTEAVVDVYSSKAKPWKVKLDLNYVDKLLGEKIPAKNVIKILKSLGLQVTGHRSQVTVTIPAYRIDLRTQEDLIEEIGRIYGYEKIVPQAPHVLIKMPALNEDRMFERKVKNILAGKGFSEIYNYSFYSQRDAGLAQLGTIEHLELENPMNPEQALMRVSLIPGILKNTSHNLKYFDDFRIFEIGRVYWSRLASTSGLRESRRADLNILPEEKRMLTGALVISKMQNAKHKARNTSFYEAKSYVDALLDRLGIDDYYYDTFDAAPADTPITLWHMSRSAAVKIEGQDEPIGFVGEINPLVLANFDIHKRVAMFEFDLEKLQKTAETEREFEPLRKYPEVLRDISMIAPGNILVDEILQTIQKAGGDLVLDADLFDIFDFADGSSSYAFHIIFGADNRTLESREVDELMEKITSSLEKELGVKVRK